MRRPLPAGNVLVIDLEATCRENDPEWMYEIIEVGAVLVCDGFKGDFWQSFVRPGVNPELSQFCRELTGIRQADVDGADRLSDVMGRFADWMKGRDIVAWGSWGASDARLLADDCARNGVPNPLEGVPHINIKKDFAKRHKIRQVGLRKATELARLPESAEHHRALSDAVAAASLLTDPEPLPGPF